ncbi:MAG: ABC transporter ATP-binding protein [Aminobacteriaceae bacterium]
MSEIRIEGVTKHFGDFVAVKDVSLVVAEHEFMVLLGPSGCGKTTLLRAIAGLGMADEGRISIGGRDVTYLPPRERHISMVFQSYAIFPHMNVFDNIAFGLRMRKEDKTEIEERVRLAAELLHIEGMLDRYPSKMSGGQRQRVAVARAIAMQAQVLLMDEPLSNLDALLRLEMRAELKQLLAKIGTTTVYVTHDQVEAMSMGDRIAVMHGGTIQQVDSPTEVYDFPANAFIGGFIGNPPMNFLMGQVRRGPGGTTVRLGEFDVAPAAEMQQVLSKYDGKPVVLGIRAENLETLNEQAPDALMADVLVVEPLGAQNLLTVAFGGHKIKVATHPAFPASAGGRVWLRLPSDSIRWMDPDTKQALRPSDHREAAR